MTGPELTQDIRALVGLVGLIGFVASGVILVSSTSYLGTPQWRRHYTIGKRCAAGMLLFGIMSLGILTN